jgi:hypothetical protein
VVLYGEEGHDINSQYVCLGVCRKRGVRNTVRILDC